MGSALSANIGWNCSLGETWGVFFEVHRTPWNLGISPNGWQEKVCGEKPTPPQKNGIGNKHAKINGIFIV